MGWKGFDAKSALHLPPEWPPATTDQVCAMVGSVEHRLWVLLDVLGSVFASARAQVDITLRPQVI